MSKGFEWEALKRDLAPLRETELLLSGGDCYPLRSYLSLPDRTGTNTGGNPERMLIVLSANGSNRKRVARLITILLRRRFDPLFERSQHWLVKGSELVLCGVPIEDSCDDESLLKRLFFHSLSFLRSFNVRGMSAAFLCGCAHTGRAA